MQSKVLFRRLGRSRLEGVRSNAGKNVSRTAPFLITAVVLVTALITTSAVSLSLHRSTERRASSVMDREIQITQANVTSGVLRYMDGVQSLSTAIGAQSDLSNEDFNAITAPLMNQNLPGAMSVNMVSPVGDHDYVVMSRSLDGGQTRVGRDLSQTPQLADALVAAQLANNVKASLPYVFDSDKQLPADQQQNGLTLVAPIVGSGSSSDVGKFRSWITIDFRSHDFAISSLSGTRDEVVNVSVAQGVGASAQIVTSVTNGTPLKNASLQRKVVVNAAGQPWALVVTPTTELISGTDAHLDEVAAIIGTAFSILVSGLVWFMVTSRRRALEQVAKATSDLRADVARREHVEEELRRTVQQTQERSEFIEVLLDAMDVGVISCDAKGRPVFVNGMARRYLGIEGPTGTPPENWGTRHGFLNPVTAEPLTMEEQPLLRALQGETVENERLLLRLENGEMCQLAVNARSLHHDDGEVFGAVVVGHDVTQLHQEMEAKSALLAEVDSQRSRYQDLLTGISELGEGVVIVEGEKIVFVNKAMAAMSGFTEGELMALESNLTLLKEEDRADWRSRVTEIERNGSMETPREMVLVRKDGEDLPCEVLSKVIHVGDRVQRLGIIRDIRSRRQIEDAVTAHAEALLHANQELIELESLREDFMGAVSHDFRTPLTSTRGFLEIALDEDDDTPLGNVRKLLERADRAASELSRRVDEFMDFSRTRRMGVQLQLIPADLKSFTEDLLEQMSPALECNPVSVRLQEAVVAIDDRSLSRVLENLLTNAVKYSPDGSTIDIRLEVEGTNACIQVEDRGSGIAVDDLERVFESYYRTEDVRGRIKGTGVGLAVVRQLVEGMNGRVWAEQRSGGGTSFCVELPLATMSSANQ